MVSTNHFRQEIRSRLELATTADSLIFDDAKETLLTVNCGLPRNQRSASPKIK